MIVVQGNTQAYAGIGDPYQPFRKALAMLTGDVEVILVRVYTVFLRGITSI
ncbi:MAG: hypothetical protein WBD56_01520 [Anaerolineales bacterium]